MNEKLVGNIVNNLPIDKMISAPLTATIKAQSDMSVALAQFVQSVGMDENGNIRMVNFNYADAATSASGENTKLERHIQVPFIAVTGIPNLAVEDVNVSFELTVSTAETSEWNGNESTNIAASAKWFSPVTAKMTGSVSHSYNQTRSTDTRAKYSFNINARKQQAPEALQRIIDTITDSVTRPMEGSGNSKLLPESEENQNNKKVSNS